MRFATPSRRMILPRRVSPRNGVCAIDEPLESLSRPVRPNPDLAGPGPDDKPVDAENLIRPGQAASPVGAENPIQSGQATN